MSEKDIQVGDKVTYIDKDTGEKIITIFDHIDRVLSYKEILKIERPKYEAIEEKKESLTKEEIIKSMKNIVKSINLVRVTTYGIFFYEKKDDGWVAAISDSINKFNELDKDKYYTLSELGLED